MKWFNFLVILALTNLFVACGGKNSTSSPTSNNVQSPASPTTTVQTAEQQAKSATTYTLAQVEEMLYRKKLTQTSSSLDCLRSVEIKLRPQQPYADVETSCDDMSSGRSTYYDYRLDEYEEKYYLSFQVRFDEYDSNAFRSYQIVSISSDFVQLNYTYDGKTITQKFSIISL